MPEDDFKLEPEIYDRLIQAERIIPKALARCAKAERCAMPDATGIRDTLEEMQRRLQAIRQEFFPNGRPE